MQSPQPTSFKMTHSVSSCKLMSLSSIMDSPFSPPSPTALPKKYPKVYMDRRASAPGQGYYPGSSSGFRSPPTSPLEEERLFESPIPSSPSSSISSTTSLRMKRTSSSVSSAAMFLTSSEERYDSEDGKMLDGNPPLTLQERRLRNKAASAKYRQKKNQQQNEMRMMINRLSEQNAVLERQLHELRLENDRLKVTTDKLRGNIVAKKMLKKWIGKQSSSHDGKSGKRKHHNQQFYHHHHHQGASAAAAAAESYNKHALNYPDQDDSLSVDTDLNSQDENDELESIISD